jgi:hypothetical protein
MRVLVTGAAQAGFDEGVRRTVAWFVAERQEVAHAR